MEWAGLLVTRDPARNNELTLVDNGVLLTVGRTADDRAESPPARSLPICKASGEASVLELGPLPEEDLPDHADVRHKFPVSLHMSTLRGYVRLGKFRPAKDAFLASELEEGALLVLLGGPGNACDATKSFKGLLYLVAEAACQTQQEPLGEVKTIRDRTINPTRKESVLLQLPVGRCQPLNARASSSNSSSCRSEASENEVEPSSNVLQHIGDPCMSIKEETDAGGNFKVSETKKNNLSTAKHEVPTHVPRVNTIMLRNEQSQSSNFMKLDPLENEVEPSSTARPTTPPPVRKAQDKSCVLPYDAICASGDSNVTRKPEVWPSSTATQGALGLQAPGERAQAGSNSRLPSRFLTRMSFLEVRPKNIYSWKKKVEPSSAAMPSVVGFVQTRWNEGRMFPSYQVRPNSIYTWKKKVEPSLAATQSVVNLLQIDPQE